MMRPPWWWCIGWSGVLLVWTVLLLLPVSPHAVEAVGGPDNAFAVGKSLHVGVYAALAWAGVWARSWRWAVPVVLLLHAAATEYLQQFTGRGSSLRDVGLNCLGVLLGLLGQWAGRLVWFGGLGRGDRVGRGSRDSRDSPGGGPTDHAGHSSPSAG